MTAYDDQPTALCSCGTSIHDSPGNRRLHENEHHSTYRPACYRLFDYRGQTATEIEFPGQFYATTSSTP